MRSWRGVVGAAFFVVALALLVWAVASRWDELSEAMTRLSVGSVVLSLVLACLGLVAQMLSWRSVLAGTGPAPDLRGSARIYYHGQLGKYVPGSVWAVVAQAELGRKYKLTRARSAVAALGALAVLLVVGGAVAVIGLAAGSPQSLSTYWWAVLVVPLGAIGLAPPVFNWVVGKAMKILRRGDEVVRVNGRGLAGSALWALAMWAFFGLHAFVLLRDLHPADPGRGLVLSTGAFALAWVVGFLVIIAPAGTGPREAALILALAPMVSSSDALLIALVSRVVMVIADAAAAGVAALLRRSTAGTDEVVAPIDDPV